jgi:hypothetical protein
MTDETPSRWVRLKSALPLFLSGIGCALALVAGLWVWSHRSDHAALHELIRVENARRQQAQQQQAPPRPQPAPQVAPAPPPAALALPTP